MSTQKPKSRNPWAWVPSLYAAEGIPYTMAITVSVILYKRLGVSNTAIAFYTSWLYLPWVIKPFWSPFVELFRTKRYWILLMQLVVGASLACIALTIPAARFFQYTLAFFWLMAFGSATHDTAADGFYMLGLSEDHQAAFVGVRTIFYRIAMVATQGGLVIFAGSLEGRGYSIPTAWSVTFFLAAAAFASVRRLILIKRLRPRRAGSRGRPRRPGSARYPSATRRTPRRPPCRSGETGS